MRKWTSQVTGMERVAGPLSGDASDNQNSRSGSGQSGSQFVRKEKYSGKWNGGDVSFTRVWGGHRFTDEECEKLLNGEIIEITSSKGRKFKGSLAKQTFRGNEFVGFKADM